MTTLKAIQADPNVTFSGASNPTQSEAGAKVDDLYHQTTSGELFRCTVETFGSQEWLGSQGNAVPIAILATDHPDLEVMHTMDDVVGKVLADESPNNKDGVITGAVQAAGYIGNALDFNGTSDSVGLPNGLADNTLSFSLWAKFQKNATGTTQILFGQSRTFQNNRALFVNTSGQLVFFSRDSSGNYRATPNSSVYADDTWHHIYCEQDGVDLKIVINDSETKTFTMPNEATGWLNDLTMGRNDATNPSQLWYAGLIDQFRCFTRPLTAEEITALANET